MLGNFTKKQSRLAKLYVQSTQKSYTEFQNNHDDPIRQKILENSLLHVNRIGWNDRAIVAACNDLGLSSASSRILPHGIMDVIEYAMKDWTKKMSYELSEHDLENMRVSERIREGVKIRLSQEIPYVNHWHQAMAIGLHPANVARTTDLLWNMADEIWYIAGDRSDDYNWYTKRGLLLGAFSSTELFMLTDRSDNFEQTWRFMDRRLNGILEMGKNLHTARNFSKAVIIGLSSLTNVVQPYPSKVEHDINNMRSTQPEAEDIHRDTTPTEETEIDKLRRKIEARNNPTQSPDPFVNKKPVPTHEILKNDPLDRQKDYVEDVLVQEKIVKKP